MKSLFDQGNQTELVQRVRQIDPGRPGRWGRLNAGRMLAHISDQLRMALGDIPSRARHVVWRYPVMKQLVIYWLPWPKGKARSPREGFTTRPTTWQEDLDVFESLVSRFAEQEHRASWPDHPLFGRMTCRAWGVLSYRHIDHHLRQFGE